MATTADQVEETPSPGATPHRITFDTFMRLGELGIYPPRTELIDGIVYDVSPKGDSHYLAQAELVEQLVLRGQQRYRVGMEPTLKLDERNGPMPDILVTPRDAAIVPERAILVVEVADSSLEYDRTKKRARYAASGVPEYWIVDLRGEIVERYLPTGIDTPALLRAGDALAPAAYPDVAIDIAMLFAAARQGHKQPEPG